MTTVVSPVSGVIERVIYTPRDIVIAIYIRGPYDVVSDDHSVFAPVTGVLSELQGKEGHFAIDQMQFIADPNKKGHLIFKIWPPRAGVITVSVEVGSGYVSDEVDWLGPSTHMDVKQGALLAEIIIAKHNSRAYVVGNRAEYRATVTQGEVVRGGSSVVLKASET
jgi:hypothetical protein